MQPKHRVTEDGKILEKMIKKAIANLEVSASEYEDIVAQAHADGNIDPDQERLLHELNQLIADGVVKRVRG